MGIGSVATFHGYPECKIRATKSAVTCLGPSSLPSSDPDSSPSSSSSDGDHTYAEAKSETKYFNHHQLIAMDIIISFIENNRHSDSTCDHDVCTNSSYLFIRLHNRSTSVEQNI